LFISRTPGLGRGGARRELGFAPWFAHGFDPLFNRESLDPQESRFARLNRAVPFKESTRKIEEGAQLSDETGESLKPTSKWV
jgi:hypothetical protein